MLKTMWQRESDATKSSFEKGESGEEMRVVELLGGGGGEVGEERGVAIKESSSKVGAHGSIKREEKTRES